MAINISVSDARKLEGDSSFDNLTFTVSLSAPAPSGGVSVRYRTIAATAKQDIDYNDTRDTLNIAAGSSSATIQVRIYGDTVDETDENFILELYSPVGASFTDDSPVLRANGIIQDNDGLGSNLALIVSNPVVLEAASGTKVAHVTATLSNVPTATITIPYQTVNGTALAGQDYTATSGSVTFLPGQTDAAVDVPIIGDIVAEPTESFSLVFSPPATVASGYNGAASVVTIWDDDAGGGASPTISISNAVLVEGDSSFNNMYFTVLLSAPAPSGGVSMDYRTIGGTAIEGVGYLGDAGTLTIAGGESSGTIAVRVYGDTADETDERFTLELANASRVFAGNAPVLRSSGIIQDNDGLGSNLALVVANPVVLEGASGTKLVHVTATLSSAAGTTITIPYQTVDGTAVAGTDYTATSGAVTFLPGQTEASVDVPVIGDAISEPTEKFSVVFAPPASIASGSNGAAGVVTILDDDAGGGGSPTISISNARLLEGDSSFDNMWFTVLLSAPAPSGGVSMTYKTVAGTATEDVDYLGSSGTLRIAAGDTSARIAVRVYGDKAVETDENFALELSNNSTSSVLAGNAPTLRANGTILDNDGGYTLSAAAISASILEGNTGTHAMHFEVILSRAVDQLVQIPFQTFDGTAVAGQDYVPQVGTVSFLPGQTEASVDVPIIGDYAVEGTETFTVVFSSASAGPATAAFNATGTIVTDDSRITVNGTPNNDTFVDQPTNQLFIGGAGHDVLTLTEGRRGDTFFLNSGGDVDFVHNGQVDTVRSVEEVKFIDGRMVFDDTDPAAQVTRLYQAALGRAPEQVGLNYWIAKIQAGDTLTSLATAFLATPEFTARFGSNPSNNDLVVRFYQNVLGRDPDPAGLGYYKGGLDNNTFTRGQVLASISESPENKGVTAGQIGAGIWDINEQAGQAARMYDTALGRLPDAGGLRYWTTNLSTGTTLLSMASSFVGSPEFVAKYGNLTTADFVNAVYQNSLHRSGDPDGITYWNNLLNSGTSRSAMIVGFSESPEHVTNTADNIMSDNPANFGIKLA